jgi:RNA polymerase sigma-70 factor, ECF subfamily
MRYPALEYQPGNATAQLSPLAPPREPRHAPADHHTPSGPDHTRALDIRTSISADQRRRGYRQAELTERLGHRLVLPEDEYARVEEMIDAARWSPTIEQALREQLTEAERSVFLLVAADELTPAQAARSLGIAAVVARMRLSRARKKLRGAVEAGGTLASAHPVNSTSP